MRRVLLTTAACLLATSGCGGSSIPDEPGAAKSRPTAEAAEVGQYDQTWTLSYEETTCAQWLGEMDEHQQYVAGADMLLGAARTENPNADLPPDPKINTFAEQISTACSAEATLSLLDTAVALVQIDPSLYDY